MESKIIITITWHGSIREEHVSQLEQAGQDRAFEMIPQGLGSGELCAWLPEGEEGGEVEYTGWWSVEFES